MFEINLNENDYSLSEIWEGINAASLNTEFLIENREVKELLIEKNGGNVCFTYPRDRVKSEIFYSRLIPSETIVETIRSKNIYKECANTLRQECLNFDFRLNNTFFDVDNLEEFYEYLLNDIPELWEWFFKSRFT